MAKTYEFYTEEEKLSLLRNYFGREVVHWQHDYDNEYHVIPVNQENGNKKIEIVNTKVAIEHEKAAFDKEEFLEDLVEALVNELNGEEELLQIGAFTKIANDIWYREL